jgi:CIC family chloride channel protein
LDDAGTFLGEVDITKIRHIVFRTELYSHFTVRQLMADPAAILGVNDPMEEVMKVFERTHAPMLPVLDSENHLIGYISRTHMYATYRQLVADLSAE